jgi:hypothetical protein
MMKGRKFLLEVEYPFPYRSKMQKAILSALMRRILLIFHDEARKIDPNCALLMD